LAFNPSGTLLASATGDGDADVRDNSVRLWNMKSGKELVTLETQHNDFMRDVVFSNDGKYLITVRGGCDCEGWGFNSAIRIWGIPLNN
jgi:WD40 repeat protein